jgi:hypothetical protein
MYWSIPTISARRTSARAIIVTNIRKTTRFIAILLKITETGVRGEA